MNEAEKEFMEAETVDTSEETIQGMPKSEYDRHMTETENDKPEDFTEVVNYVMVDSEIKPIINSGEIKIRIHDGNLIDVYDVYNMQDGTTEILIEL